MSREITDKKCRCFLVVHWKSHERRNVLFSGIAREGAIHPNCMGNYDDGAVMCPTTGAEMSTRACQSVMSECLVS